MLARLQETGRYALTRITDDLRMGSAQYCGECEQPGLDGSGGQRRPDLSGAYHQRERQWRFTAANGSFPDSGGLLGVLPGAGATYPIGPADFMQGYDCSTAGRLHARRADRRGTRRPSR